MIPSGPVGPSTPNCPSGPMSPRGPGSPLGPISPIRPYAGKRGKGEKQHYYVKGKHFAKFYLKTIFADKFSRSSFLASIMRNFVGENFGLYVHH